MGSECLFVDSFDSPDYFGDVSFDCIICECGENFSDERSLRIHLENNDHSQSKEEDYPSYADTTIKSEFDEEPVAVEEYIEATDEHSLTGLDEANHAAVLQYVGEEQEVLSCRRVTFKKELVSDDVVILDQENLEHDYHRETPKPEVHVYYFCDVCGKAFNSEKSLRMHAAKVHERGAGAGERAGGGGGGGGGRKKKSVVCDICGKKYMMWQRTCAGCGNKRPVKKKWEKRFTCEICGQKRTSNAALRYHQRVHTGERPYTCSYCPKTFTMPLFLQIHERTHTGERPYQCETCPKAFGNKAALLRHNRDHTGERPYRCETCPKTFKNRTALTRHHRVHTGERPYTCPQCGKSFTQSNSMKLHYQTVHLRMPAPYKSAARRLRAARNEALGLIEKRRKYRCVSSETIAQLNISQHSDSEYVIEEAPYSDTDEYG